MRNLTVVAILLVAGSAFAQPKAKDPAAAAKAAIDKADELFNAHDAKALGAMIDDSFFGEGPFIGAVFNDAASFRTHIEKMLAEGGRETREDITIRPDPDGNSAWFIADYTFVPKVPPGALPIHRKIRESGALVRRGKEWKFAMLHVSHVQPDPPAPVQTSGGNQMMQKK
jgi:hypothetical protein